MVQANYFKDKRGTETAISETAEKFFLHNWTVLSMDIDFLVQWCGFWQVAPISRYQLNIQ